MPLPKNVTDEIIAELEKRLKAKGTSLKCPICARQDFFLTPSYTHRALSDKINSLNLGGKLIPSLSLVCNNCGFILDFAVGTLGFIKAEEDGEKNAKK